MHRAKKTKKKKVRPTGPRQIEPESGINRKKVNKRRKRIGRKSTRIRQKKGTAAGKKERKFEAEAVSRFSFAALYLLF